MSTRSSGTVEWVWKVSPHEHRTVATTYSGWMPCFMVGDTPHFNTQGKVPRAGAPRSRKRPGRMNFGRSYTSVNRTRPAHIPTAPALPVARLELSGGAG